MLISKIEKLKNNKYKIIVNGESITTFDNVILDNNLLYKKDIDDVLYNKIMEDTEYYNVYNNVVKNILKRRRSEKEIKEYLLKHIDNEKKIDSIILKLKDIHLIDDIAYCKAFINDSIYLGKNGINKIKQNLLNQNISIDIIEQTLSEINIDIIDERLEKIILKKINMNKKYSNTYLKQKILNEMINLGYDKEKIITILDSNLLDNNIALNTEFKKQYIKLSKKYSGEELLKNIKIKLLQKGFYNNDIDNLIEEKQKN